MRMLELMNQHVPISLYLDFFLRILAASVCGALIGMERGRRLKEAGIRTHMLVCGSAALIIIVSKYGFADLTNPDGSDFFGLRGSDPARIAAQVVSGISFLCAGVIFKQGNMVKGLTTAAGLWATAGIGLALGAGMLLLGAFATLLVLMLQIVLHRLPIRNDQFQNNQLEITVGDNTGFREALTRQLSQWQAQVLESSITRNKDGSTTYAMLIRMSNAVTQEDIFTFLDQNSAVTSFRQTMNT